MKISALSHPDNARLNVEISVWAYKIYAYLRSTAGDFFYMLIGVFARSKKPGRSKNIEQKLK